MSYFEEEIMINKNTIVINLKSLVFNYKKLVNKWIQKSIKKQWLREKLSKNTIFLLIIENFGQISLQMNYYKINFSKPKLCKFLKFFIQ